MQNVENEIVINTENYLQEKNIVEQQNYFLDLVSKINYLMDNNFEALIFLLYRIDVSENKITEIAKNNLLDANIITQLIIERIAYKLQHKKDNTLPKTNIDINDADKW